MTIPHCSPDSQSHCYLQDDERLRNHFAGLWRMLEDRVPFMRGRDTRVASITQAIGQRLALNPKQLFALSIAGLYHDMGMIGIPDTLLLKNGPLTPEEELIVHRHVEYSGRALAVALADCPDALEAIWYHHERPDGTGYFKLSGSNLPLLAGIVAVAEAIEAMASPRPHRPALAPPAIAAELKKNTNSQFLPQIIDVALPILPELIALANKDASPNPAPVHAP